MTPTLHLHFPVADLQQSGEFYRHLFGAPVKTKPGYLKFLPDFAPLNLALSQREASARDAIDDAGTHYGVQCTKPEDVRWHLQRVKSAGLPVRVEIAVDCCFANQDKFWVRDPDGREWEFYYLNYDLSDAAAPAVPTAACAADSACCQPANPPAPVTFNRG